MSLNSLEFIIMQDKNMFNNLPPRFFHYTLHITIRFYFMWIPRDGFVMRLPIYPWGIRTRRFLIICLGSFITSPSPFTMSNYPASDIEAANDICPVCFEILVGKAIKRVRFCQHKFCKECFAKLLKVKLEEPDENLVKPKCPLCRGPIRINEVRTLQ